MPIVAPDMPSRGPSQVPEVGTHPARLVGVATLGLQPQRPYQGQEKDPQYEITHTYELCYEHMVGEDGKPDESKPFWVSETVPFFSNSVEKSKCAKRYKALDPKDEYKGDWEQLIGAPCMVTVVHNPKKTDPSIVYANIDNTSPMAARQAKGLPSLVNEPLVFNVDDPDLEVFNRLPEFLRKKIVESLSFEGSALQKLGVVTPVAAPTSKPATKNVDVSDDEPPF